MIRNTAWAWGGVSRGLHWLIGLTILGMLAFGWWMNHIPARPDRFFYRQIHADIGYVLLLLLVIRIVWRLFNPAPELRPRWLGVLARLHHWVLDFAALLVVMLGWAHSGAHTPNYASWFGLFQVPQITSPDKAAAQIYEDRHIVFAYVLLALLAIHVAAAIWHHRIRRDTVVLRMLRGEAS